MPGVPASLPGTAGPAQGDRRQLVVFRGPAGTAWTRPRSRATGEPRGGAAGAPGLGLELALVKDGVSLQQLVDGLNSLGIGPRDLIAILQAIKAAGAIQADIEVM